MSGMETMMKTLLGAMGFDPKQFTQGAQTFVNSVNETMKHCMEQFAAIHAKLDRIERSQAMNHIQVVLKLEEIKPGVPACVLEPDETLNGIIIPFDAIATVDDATMSNAA